MRTAQVFKLFGQHVAAFEVWDDENIGLTGDGRDQSLDFGGLGADGGVEGQWTVENAAGDLAAVCHFAESRSVEGGFDLRVYGFDGGEQRHLGLGNAEGVGQVDGVLHDVDLILKLGGDVDGRIRDQQGTGVGRGVHDENVGDAAGSAKTRVGLHRGFHHLVSMETALHHG